jgi:protein-disulfide isomerase
MDKNLIIAIALSLIVGFVGGFLLQNNQNEGLCLSELNTNPSDAIPSEGINMTVVNNSLEYINKHLLKPGVVAKITNVSKHGDNLYRMDLVFTRNDEPVGESFVYITKDGSTLILNSVDLTQEPEAPRTEVSADDDPFIGKEDAKVVIIEFSDFTCPYCAKLEKEVIPKIIEKYGDDVRIVYRDFPIHGNKSIMTSSAANCAGEQGKYWEYHNMLFERQTEWIEENLTANNSPLYKYAEELGLNLDDFKTCLQSDKYVQEIQKDYLDGLNSGVTGTPTLFINGIKVVGFNPPEKYYEIIDQELEGER